VLALLLALVLAALLLLAWQRCYWRRCAAAWSHQNAVSLLSWLRDDCPMSI
jgi:hypothetical protein